MLLLPPLLHPLMLPPPGPLQDVYSKARTPLIKELKQEGLTWVSKYARGGSARKQSARKMYTAVDAVVGHFAANG